MDYDELQDKLGEVAKPLPVEAEPGCLHCTEARQQLRDAAEENAHLTEEVSGLLALTREQARKIQALKRELRDDTGAKSEIIQELFEYHAKLRKEWFPKTRARNLPLDGKHAKAIRKVLTWPHPFVDRKLTVDDIKLIFDGAFSSEYHRGNVRYLEIASVLEHEDKISAHLERAGAAEYQRVYRKEQEALIRELEDLINQRLILADRPPTPEVLKELEECNQRVSTIASDARLEGYVDGCDGFDLRDLLPVMSRYYELHPDLWEAA